MRLALSLSLLLVLAACGDADMSDADVPTDAATPVAETSAPAAAPAPDGSLGTFTLRFAESDAEGAPAAEVSGHLPPPVPADAYPTVDLAEAPNYHVGVDKEALPAGVELGGTHFVYVKRDADGALDKAQLLRGWVGLSNSFSGGTYSGTVGGFTLAALWPDTAPAATLTYDATGDDERQIATSELAVLDRPAWAQPVTLPATVEDPEVTAEVALARDDVRLYLLYREADGTGGEATWNLEDFRPNRSVNRQREDDPAAPATTAFTVYPDDLGDGPTEAYLLAFPL